MRAEVDDVIRMVRSLMNVMGGIERAGRADNSANATMLDAIAVSEPVRPSDLAALLNVHQSSVTRRTRALITAGFVAGQADPDDGRAHRLVLTDAGRGELTRLNQVGLENFTPYVADWDAHDVRRLAALLEELKKEMDASGGHD